ncbi:adhT [Symbiodinium microadriaticum]|nr:adhT [Symbiodinium microadriaticum]
MKAAIYHSFEGPIQVTNVHDPVCQADGVVIEVMASGVCLSDWHGWMGHDPDIRLPHVPGHELAGKIVEIGEGISKFKVGDRVTVPFVSGCGNCAQCTSENHQICDFQFQPGFTHWGSFAQYVGIHYADTNLVALPESVSYSTAASLGCRFATSFRAIVDQGRAKSGDWVAVFGCGGVGLSAIMIANALGAQVVAIDIHSEKSVIAKEVGARHFLNGSDNDLVEQILDISDGGVHLTIDAIGSNQVVANAIRSLRKRGRHVQVGLLTEGDSPIPGDLFISRELEFVGSHGMQAFRYKDMLDMIEMGKLNPQRLTDKELSLSAIPQVLPEMSQYSSHGIQVITDFS